MKNYPYIHLRTQSSYSLSESALNIDLSSNLTKKQQYTVEQIQLARTGTNTVDHGDLQAAKSNSLGSLQV